MVFYEKGYFEKPRYLELFGHDYYPHLFGGGPMSKRGMVKGDTSRIIVKYMSKYPETMNVILRNQARAQRVGEIPHNPLTAFIKRCEGFINKGYNFDKAFELTEQQMAGIIETEKEESRVIRGFAYTNHARSYLNYAQQLAEMEGRAKMLRVERDVAKYK